MNLFGNKHRDKVEAKDMLYVSFFLAFTLLFFGPYHLYFYNVLEYQFYYTELFIRLFILSLFLTAIFLVIIILLQKIVAYEKIIATVFAIALLFWLQGNVLVWEYGQFDGKQVNWDDKIHFGLIDSSIWLVFLVVAFWKSSWLYRIARIGSIIFILVQSASLCILFLQTPLSNFTRFEEDNSSMFTFSREKNVIVFLLDSFQTDIFKEITSEDSYYKKIFDGFTYFPNSVSGYPSTYPSIPLILTGKYYDNSIPIQEFIKKEYAINSVPKRLKENGYHVYLNRAGTYVPFDTTIASNFIEKSDIGSFNFKELIPLIDGAFFRYFPHFTKRIFFNKTLGNLTNWSGESETHRDLRFLNNIKKNSKLDSFDKTFKFYHFFGTHVPFRLNSDLEYEELEINRFGLKEQAKAILKIVGESFEVMKNLEIWDNSMIIILADHGLGTPEAPSVTANKNMAYLNPLMLVKPFDDRGEMKTSNAPVHLSDIPKTIFSELGLSNNYSGYSMLELDESLLRVRRYLSFDWQRFGVWGNLFLPEMKEFFVTGDSWLSSSWKETHVVYLPNQKVNLEKYKYSFGKKIRFGTDGNSLKYEKRGWTRAEKNKNISFAIGKNSSLTFPVIPSATDIVLQAKIAPFLAKGMPSKQQVLIKVNGNVIGKWLVTSAEKYSLIIPQKYIKGARSLDVTFEMPNAKSTQELGIGNDPRPLSIVIEWLSLDNVS